MKGDLKPYVFVTLAGKANSFAFETLVRSTGIHLKARLYMRFLSQQPDANFVALKCKPGAISRRFYSEINRHLGATH